MSGTRILWGQVLLVGAIALLFVWGATQWTAWRLGFQPQLGPPIGEALGWPIYAPPAFFVWWYWYDAYAPRVFMEGAYIASGGGFVKRMQQARIVKEGVSTLTHTVRSGDRGGSGSSISVSEDR